MKESIVVEGPYHCFTHLLQITYERSLLSQVNRVSVISMQHSEVVAAIKAGGDETTMLVVDAETEEFFKRCNVLPAEEHVTGMMHQLH